ncbi:MAG TPA: hypothetical protein PLU53_04425 [Bacteroidia bacterium]|nr:hypothetical protein [Bacteroidia bacterium]
MKKKMVAEGRVVLRDKAFFYEFWSDNLQVTIKIYRNGNKGECIEFIRCNTLNLKNEMEAALVNARVLK